MGSNPAWRNVLVSPRRYGHTLTGEVTIRFETRTTGLFLVVKPVLEGGEVFDSGMLREKIQGLVSEGQRNLAIDLSGLNYLYSDAMNVLFNLNRQVLDVNGRLALVGPTSDVAQILQAAGIYNFLKVYDTEDDLLRSSEEIIMQTSGYSLNALKQQAGISEEKPPVSEFEDLRSGIEQSMELESPAVQQPPRRPAPAQPQQRPPEQPIQKAPPQQQRPATPPPPPVPPRPSQPEVPSFEPPVSHKEPSHFPEPEPADSHDDWEDEDVKKKSPVAAIVIVVLLLAGISGAGFYFWPQLSAMLGGFTESPQETVTNTPPQLPVEQEPVVTEETESAEEEKVEEPEEAPKETVSRPARSASRSTSSSTRRSTPRPAPKPAPRRTSTPSASNEMVIRTSPAGATISIDGRIVGKSPYTWNDPKVRGAVRIKAELDGYSPKTSMVEYLGGEKEEMLVLVEAPKPAPKPVATSTPPPPPPAPKPEPPTPSASTPSAPPPAPAPSTPEPPAPAASSQSSGEPATVFISSIPPVADVYLDGKLIGKTNISKLNVLSGTHTMKFVKSTKEHTVEMTFKPGDNPAKHVTF